jgi:prepilin-type N-terminal cleavage/methylation domain-containing protein
MRPTNRGFTLIEVLVALVLILVAVGSMIFVQFTNLRTTVSARLLTETKAAANVVLEDLMAQVLVVENNPSSVTDFNFYHYYWSCPTPQTPPSGPAASATGIACSGTRTINDIAVAFAIHGASGVLGEGILTVTVTGTHSTRGQTLTIGSRITCYDIYPSPSATAPEPCPRPILGGGGRS